jgi:hypothetical protein
MDSRLESQPADTCAGVSASFIWKICYAEMNIVLQIVHVGEVRNRRVFRAALLLPVPSCACSQKERRARSFEAPFVPLGKQSKRAVPLRALAWILLLSISDYYVLQDYLAWRFAFLAAFCCDFEYFLIDFCCFLDAFFSFLFWALADFLSNSRELRAYSATPGLCALAGIDQATLNAARSVKTATRFM